jgi:hypothetical protein
VRSPLFNFAQGCRKCLFDRGLTPTKVAHRCAQEITGFNQSPCESPCSNLHCDGGRISAHGFRGTRSSRAAPSRGQGWCLATHLAIRVCRAVKPAGGPGKIHLPPRIGRSARGRISVAFLDLCDGLGRFPRKPGRYELWGVVSVRCAAYLAPSDARSDCLRCRPYPLWCSDVTGLCPGEPYTWIWLYCSYNLWGSAWDTLGSSLP